MLSRIREILTSARTRLTPAEAAASPRRLAAASLDPAEAGRISPESLDDEPRQSLEDLYDFLAALSHELRTPLTPVLLKVNEMLQSHRLHESLRDGLEMIERSVQAEVRLIDDLLDLTRISRGQIKAYFEVRDVHRLLADAERLCRERSQEKNLSIDLLLEASEHHVWGDAARLEQVFWKLLDNAVKFSSAGGWVEVRTSNLEHAQIRIDVRDHGLGIPPEVLPRLFQPFERGRVARPHFEGLGLGLAIAKSLVDLHGGTLTAASDGAGQGSTFSVVLGTVPLPARLQTRPDRPKPALRHDRRA